MMIIPIKNHIKSIINYKPNNLTFIFNLNIHKKYVKKSVKKPVKKPKKPVKKPKLTRLRCPNETS